MGSAVYQLPVVIDRIGGCFQATGLALVSTPDEVLALGVAWALLEAIQSKVRDGDAGALACV